MLYRTHTYRCYNSIKNPFMIIENNRNNELALDWDSTEGAISNSLGSVDNYRLVRPSG